MCRRAVCMLIVGALVAAGAGLFLSATAEGASWPQWKGPNRNGTTSEPAGTWPPTKEWEVSLGYSDSSPIIVNGKVYVLELDGSSTRVKCLNADTGAQIWTGTTPGGRRGRYYSSADSTQYYGPLSTPACDGTYLFTLSVDGDLQCWDANSSTKNWGFNLYDKYNMGQRANVGGGMRDFGYMSGPLLSGSNVIVGVGGNSGCVMSFSKSSGSKTGGWGSGQWGSTSGPASADGKVYLNLSYLVINGTSIGWETDFACNIATPGVSNSYVVATSSYNPTNFTKCYDKSGNQRWSTTTREKVHSPVIHESAGNVYLAGTGKCLNLSNGSTKWSFGGCSSVVVTGDNKLIVMDITLRLYDSSGTQLSSVGTGIGRGYPSGAFGEGKIIWKNRTKVACFSVGGAAPSPTNPPTGVSASDGTYTDKVRVTWNSSSGATAYEVWRNTTNSSGSATRIADSLTVTTHDDTSVTPEMTYYYWVKAKNAVGTSGFSASDSGYAHVVPETITVTAPSGGSFRGKQDVTITWMSNFSGNVKIEFSQNGGSSWTVVAGSTGNDGTYELPLANTTSSNCVFRVSDASDGDPWDVSGTFSVTRIADADGDRMDDDWEVSRLGGTGVSNGGSTDTDGDGVPDLEEFWNGTDPAGGGGGRFSSTGCAAGASGAAAPVLAALAFLASRIGRRRATG